MADIAPQWPAGEFLLYQTEDGRTRIQCRFEGETLWLTQQQMADLFQVDKSGVSRHLRNIFDSGELAVDAVVAKFATTAADCQGGQIAMAIQPINAISNRLSLRPPQRRSLELLARVCEIMSPAKDADPAAALAAIKSEFPTVEDFERHFPSLCFALATGVGKTRLMGAFIAYLFQSEGIRNFFVLAPNLTPSTTDRHRRKSTWSEKNPEGRWRGFDYDELIRRDKVNLDLFWLRDKSLEDGDDLPDPDVIAEEIADDLQRASTSSGRLRRGCGGRGGGCSSFRYPPENGPPQHVERDEVILDLPPADNTPIRTRRN